MYILKIHGISLRGDHMHWTVKVTSWEGILEEVVKVALEGVGVKEIVITSSPVEEEEK